jgi:hypothetical protein
LYLALIYNINYNGIEHHNLDKNVALVLRLGFGFCISSFTRLRAASTAAPATFIVIITATILAGMFSAKSTIGIIVIIYSIIGLFGGLH